MQISELYLHKIQELYDLTDGVMAEYRAGAEQLEQHLEGYDWKDINAAINRYYNRRSSITPPKVQQIIAIAEDNGAPRWVSNPDSVEYHMPRTNLFVIKDTFDKMIQIMVDCGVIPNDSGNLTATHSLIDPQTELPMLNPKQVLAWQVEDAIREHPDLFAKFDNLSFWEQLAICLQNKVVTIRVRNWSAYAQNHNVMGEDKKIDLHSVLNQL